MKVMANPILQRGRPPWPRPAILAHGPHFAECMQEHFFGRGTTWVARERDLRPLAARKRAPLPLESRPQDDAPCPFPQRRAPVARLARWDLRLLPAAGVERSPWERRFCLSADLRRLPFLQSFASKAKTSGGVGLSCREKREEPGPMSAGSTPRRKCVVYRASSRSAAKQRAAADSELHHWVILAAHWRPAPDSPQEDRGGALVVHVEEPDA